MGVILANPEHIDILKQGVKAWNHWRSQPSAPRPNLQGAYVSESSMDWAIPHLAPPLFLNANLETIDLADASLEYAILSGANLRAAKLTRARMTGADLRGADLRGADLRGAKLMQVNFTLSTLSGANVKGATFWETVLARTNLSEAVGLDKARHGGPSIIDHRTLKKSGRVPLTFLQGCGLPDAIIGHVQAIVREPASFASVFISYSTADDRFARSIHRSLQKKGVRCWFAPHDLSGGKKLRDQIENAILSHDRLLLILSDHSMASEWVKTEIAEARRKEMQQKRQVLFPVSLVPFETLKSWKLFDADIGKDSAREIREYFIPDFSNWRSSSAYSVAFRSLLAGLIGDHGAT
jgi:uncharacterized protein YjbI with pentapeptide repeats